MRSRAARGRLLVAALGVLGGIAAVLVDCRRWPLYLLGIPVTLNQVVVWYAVTGLPLAPVDVPDTLTQVAPVASLAWSGRRHRRIVCSVTVRVRRDRITMYM